MHVIVEEHSSMTQTAGCPKSTGGTVKIETYQAEREHSELKLIWNAISLGCINLH